MALVPPELLKWPTKLCWYLPVPTNIILRWGQGPGACGLGVSSHFSWSFMQDLPCGLICDVPFLSHHFVLAMTVTLISSLHCYPILETMDRPSLEALMSQACGFSFLPIQSFSMATFQSVLSHNVWTHTNSFVAHLRDSLTFLFPLFLPSLCWNPAVCILKQTYWSCLVKVKWKGKDLKAVPSTGKNWKGVGVLMNKEGKMRM